MEKTNPISDNSSLNISLPMIIQAVTFIVMGVWGYSQLNARISFLEYQVAMNEEHIIDLEEDAEKNQMLKYQLILNKIKELNILNAKLKGLEINDYI